MNPISKPSMYLRSIVFAFVGMAVLWPVMPLTASQTTAHEKPSQVNEWFDQQAAFFADHEDLQHSSCWSWRHLDRVKRFVDARTINGVLPAAGDRVRAWNETRTRRNIMEIRDNYWTSIGPPNISGRIVDLKFHPSNPQLVYAASASGGLWISSDGGDTWRTTTDDLPSLAIGAVCVVPTDPDVVLIATGEGLNWTYVVYGVGIWKSMDGGETWNPTSLTHQVTDNHGFHVMEANPITGTVLAGANDGLWRSTDKGDTWTHVRADGDYFDVKWKPGSANRVYAAKGRASSNNGVLVSTDDGLTWTLTGTGLPPSNRINKTRLAVTPSNTSVIYAHIGDTQTNGSLGIYRSTDNGITWTARNTSLNISGGQGGYSVTIAVDPADTQRVIAGGIELYLSTNGGLSFSETGGGNPLGDETSVHVDQHAIVWEPGSTSNVWIGTDGGTWRSTDSGETWHQRRDGLITTQFYDVCLDPNDPAFVMAGSQDNGLPWVEEEGESWFPSTLLADGLACHVEPLSPDTIHSEYQFGGHIRSMNRGQSWDFTMNGLSGGSTAFAPLDLDPNRAGHLYTATYDGVFRTLNAQDLWIKVALHSPTWISISPVDGNIIWTTGGNTGTGGFPVRFSINDGSSWNFSQQYGFAVGNETKIVSHPTNAAIAFVTFAGYSGVAHVARTTNFGQSWEDVSGDFPPDPANTMAIDPVFTKHWFVGTDTGVWHSTNQGATWMPFGSGFPNVLVYDLEIHKAARKLVACTYGRGIWAIDLPPRKTWKTLGNVGMQLSPPE